MHTPAGTWSFPLARLLSRSGASGARHRYPGPTFVYVLEGAVEIELEERQRRSTVRRNVLRRPAPASHFNQKRKQSRARANFALPPQPQRRAADPFRSDIVADWLAQNFPHKALTSRAITLPTRLPAQLYAPEVLSRPNLNAGADEFVKDTRLGSMRGRSTSWTGIKQCSLGSLVNAAYDVFAGQPAVTPGFDVLVTLFANDLATDMNQSSEASNVCPSD